MHTEIVHMHHTLSQQQLRIIDLEARSRRNNLLFFNIPEPEQESDTGCEQALCDFLATQLKLNEEQLSRVVFQHVHRLGRPRHGVAWFWFWFNSGKTPCGYHCHGGWVRGRTLWLRESVSEALQGWSFGYVRIKTIPLPDGSGVEGVLRLFTVCGDMLVLISVST